MHENTRKFRKINEDTFGFDVVYRPRTGTGFLEYFGWKKRIEGIKMLVFQASSSNFRFSNIRILEKSKPLGREDQTPPRGWGGHTFLGYLKLIIFERSSKSYVDPARFQLECFFLSHRKKSAKLKNGGDSIVNLRLRRK